MERRSGKYNELCGPSLVPHDHYYNADNGQKWVNNIDPHSQTLWDHAHQNVTELSTQSPEAAYEKILWKCDVVCQIFSVEHFVAAAAINDDSNRENAALCVSPIAIVVVQIAGAGNTVLW